MPPRVVARPPQCLLRWVGQDLLAGRPPSRLSAAAALATPPHFHQSAALLTIYTGYHISEQKERPPVQLVQIPAGMEASAKPPPSERQSPELAGPKQGQIKDCGTRSMVPRGLPSGRISAAQWRPPCGPRLHWFRWWYTVDAGHVDAGHVVLLGRGGARILQHAVPVRRVRYDRPRRGKTRLPYGHVSPRRRSTCMSYVACRPLHRIPAG
jgi:hypothetical protein